MVGSHQSFQGLEHDGALQRDSGKAAVVKILNEANDITVASGSLKFNYAEQRGIGRAEMQLSGRPSPSTTDPNKSNQM